MAGNHRSGARKLATSIKLLRGSRVSPEERARHARQVPALPTLPSYLKADPEARACYRAFGRELVRLGVCEGHHGPALALLSDAWLTYQRATAEFAAMGRKTLITTSWLDGQDRVHTRTTLNPIVRALRQHAELVTKLLAEFGLTAASAARVTRAVDVSEDLDEKYFANRPALLAHHVDDEPIDAADQDEPDGPEPGLETCGESQQVSELEAAASQQPVGDATADQADNGIAAEGPTDEHDEPETAD